MPRTSNLELFLSTEYHARMAELFEQPVQAGEIVAVAVNANVWRAFDYVWPDALGTPPAVGVRVRVPFGRGNRKTLGFVTALDSATGTQPAPGRSLKAVAEVIDASPQLDALLLRLGDWIAQYYLCPLGMTLAAMVPSAVGRRRAPTETMLHLASADRRSWPAKLGPKQRSVLDELYEAGKQGIESLSDEQVLRHSKAGRATLTSLLNRGLISQEVRPARLPELNEEVEPDPFGLNDEQQAALEGLRGKLAGGFSVSLLHGVTGSGKTEVYIRAIRQVVAAGRQAILMVPEIALATQTLERLLKRLPRVAVLHSGLTDAQRAFYYRCILAGQADVVVGPRSAIFAPTRKLGLIIVDEEHEPSYKQDTAPRYHGRDVAVMRGSIESVPVILGSATPSLESFRNAQTGRYTLLRLPHRVRSLPMPRLDIVNLRHDIMPGRVELLGATLTRRMAEALDRQEQIILLMNRRGYASHVLCPSCHWLMTCDNCTRAMVFHQATQTVLCHYCQHTATLPERCPACKGKLLLFGLGIQRIEAELSRKFPGARMARMDSDTMTSPLQFRKVLDGFGAGEIDILLGTQMVAKGLDFPRVSLVGVASADTSLALHDFRAAERTFQLIVQVAGRAGRADLPGLVVVQTLNENEPSIQFASRHDYDGFAASELPSRNELHYPPFARMLRFIVRHADPKRATDAANKLTASLRELLSGRPVAFQGPQPATVQRIRNLHRFELLLTCVKPGLMQQALAPHMETLARDIPAEFIVDVDPLNLL